MTSQSANVVARHDYLPFGDEIPGGVAGRNSQFGPYTDNVDEKFTGHVRDTETLNDFFNARYYTAPLMRFLSSDPGNAGADPTDPQTWNGYAYVRSNPLNATDPSGTDICPDGTWASVCVTDSAPPDLESICWWCWEYGSPYTGSPQPTPPPAPPPATPNQQKPAKGGACVPPLAVYGADPTGFLKNSYVMSKALAYITGRTVGFGLGGGLALGLGGESFGLGAQGSASGLIATDKNGNIALVLGDQLQVPTVIQSIRGTGGIGAAGTLESKQ